ncbi:hypothetical protein N0B44_18455 [Roseibacterium beibuensis]|uniref:hypothetical protein n=1 Tax=[Roseibacterium] beibuensis TaxID=1193142 RepID=UPI00217E4C2E|nr:hypothetical protein [Roseibacterium beibuensis]MCS6624900.1 hypothetical protein [Roseibacterium beibuensis]
MEYRAVEQWSLTRSLALLAAIFAIVVGATLPTAVAASPVTGHPVQLCSGERIFVDDAGQPVRPEPGRADSLKCAACLAGAFTALTPPAPADAAASAPCPGPTAHPVPALSAPAHAVRLAPRPPSTAPPIA